MNPLKTNPLNLFLDASRVTMRFVANTEAQ